MRTKFNWLLGVLFLYNIANGQQAVSPTKFFPVINATELKENLSIYASDALEGRYTGSRGQKMAAAFIEAQLRSLNLEPIQGQYQQKFSLYTDEPFAVSLYVQGNGLTQNDDFYFVGSQAGNGQMEKPYLINEGQEPPQKLNGTSTVMFRREGAFSVYTQNPDDLRVEELIKAGAKNMLIVTDTKGSKLKDLIQYKQRIQNKRKFTSEPPAIDQEPLNLFIITQSSLAKWAGVSEEQVKAAFTDKKEKIAKEKLSSLSWQYTIAPIKPIETENVFAVLPGTDLKNEYIVISAHLDHIGKEEGVVGDNINNGADDDGSGTVSVLQIAKAFAEAKKAGYSPRRSILFLLFTGEEEGLLGSEYYTEHPLVPLAQTVVDLNIDMVGRRDAEHEGKPDYVYAIGSNKLSQELHKLHESMNQQYTKMEMDYLYNDEKHPDRLYYRSDHWNFAKNNIPIIFYFDGIHADYHQVSDEVDKIDFALLTKRAQLVFATAWQVADLPKRLALDKK